MPCKAHHNTLQLTFKHASRCLQCWCLGLVQFPCVNLESGETNLPSAMPVHDQASQVQHDRGGACKTPLLAEEQSMSAKVRERIFSL